jgi:hypothetical protein
LNRGEFLKLAVELFRDGGVRETGTFIPSWKREGRRRKLAQSCWKLACVLREDLGGGITLATGSASNPAKASKPAELLPARARRTRKSRIVVPPSPADTSTLECSHAPSKLTRRR